nr:DUF4825 domain-containing protein [Lachnospiraceae bacterium]
MMKNKLPCELIRDLFPSYIDKLTSDVTNQMVEEHVLDCADCKEALDAMREPDVTEASVKDDVQQKEIDFLKKTRHQSRRVVVISVLGAFIIFLSLVFANMFIIGDPVGSESVYCKAEVRDNILTLQATMTDSARVPCDIHFEEEEPGIVNVSFKAVLAGPWNNCGVMTSEYAAKSEMKQVKVGERIIWAEGEDILAITSAVYAARHPYVGDMPANALPIAALNMGSYLGNFSNELQTTREPYGWKFILEEEMTSQRAAIKENMLKSYAYVLLAVVENLGEVTYEYVADGEKNELTVTIAEATEFAGYDIKDCYDNVLLLQKLIQKTGLDGYAFMDAEEALALQQAMEAQKHRSQQVDAEARAQEELRLQTEAEFEREFNSQVAEGKEIGIKIINNTEDEIAMMGISYSLGGEHKGMQAGGCADEDRAIRQGESMTFTFYPLDFELSDWKNDMEIVMQAEVYDEQNYAFPVKPEFKVAAKAGAVYTYILSGNAKDGYEIGQ